jgi:hypothetical protein
VEARVLDNNPANAQVILLSALLQLEKEARHAENHTALGFFMANDTHRLVPFDQCIIWRVNHLGTPQIQAVSGVSTIDKGAPFIRWLARLARTLAKDPNNADKVHIFEAENLPSKLQKTWERHINGVGVWCPFADAKHGLRGGMMMFRADPAWRESEIALLERLTDAYSHAWRALEKNKTKVFSSQKKFRRRLIFWSIFTAIVLALYFIDVHESVLVPAEVVATKPIVVSAPLNGTIKTIHVQPNQAVEAGDPLFSLNDTEQRNSYLIAQESLAVAQAELLSTEQKAFTDLKSKSDVALLRAKVKERQAQLNYVKDQLDRMVINAEQDGIAVFTDPNDWLGKPVSVGEKVMSLADPRFTEIRLNIPIADAITLYPGARVLLFLYTDPTRPYEAELYQAAYEAEVTPEDVMAFRAKAKFNEEFSNQDRKPPRIGLKGTGKIYGREVPLYYYLFRRPWASFRKTFGV